MVYRIVFDVEETPSQESMRETTESVWNNGNTKWEEFTVFGYLPGMDVGSAAYAVAKFRQTGMTDFRIQSFALPGTKWKKKEFMTHMRTLAQQVAVD